MGEREKMKTKEEILKQINDLEDKIQFYKKALKDSKYKIIIKTNDGECEVCLCDTEIEALGEILLENSIDNAEIRRNIAKEDLERLSKYGK